jgi:hypothetical protein
MTAQAAPDDTFEADGIWYKVLTDDEYSRTAEVWNNQGFVGSADEGFDAGIVTIPAAVDASGAENKTGTPSGIYNVTSISGGAFQDCMTITRLVLYEAANLQTIGTNAFNSCFQMQGPLYIPANLISIGDAAFGGCGSLGILEMNDAMSLQSIGDYAFYNCGNLTGGGHGRGAGDGGVETSFPDGPDGTAYVRDTLSFPPNLISIGESAFEVNNVENPPDEWRLPIVFTSAANPGTIQENAFNSVRYDVVYAPEGAAYTEEPGFPDATLISTHFLTLSAGENGRITYTGQQGFYAPGELVRVHATPDGGYAFSEWTAATGSFDDANNAHALFTMPDAAVTVRANFTLIDDTEPGTAPVVKPGQGTQSGTAVPASSDGLTAAVPYTANVGAWFEDADGDALTYSVVSEDADGIVALSGGTLTFTPTDADANKSRTIVVKANDGQDDSTSNVTISVAVGAVPIDRTEPGGGEEEPSDVITVPPHYSPLKHFGLWSGTGDLSARIDADYRLFVRLLYKGAVIDPGNYTLTEGSTIITLKESYLKTYANGTHEFVAEFSDGGTAAVSLTVNAPAAAANAAVTNAETTAGAAPRTGDDAALAVWFAMVGLSLLGIGSHWILGLRRKRHPQE